VRVILVRAGALGDALLLRRAISWLRAAAHRADLMAPAPGAVLQGPGGSEVERWWAWDGPDVARLLARDGVSAAPREEPSSIVRALREADAVVAYTRSRDVVSALGAAARRLLVQDPEPPSGTHASSWLTRPLSELGVTAGPDPPDLIFSRDELTAAAAFSRQLPRGFLALHPGSGSPAKNWPAERFVALARELQPGRPTLLVLGPAEAGLEHLDDPPTVVARNLPLRVLGALLSRAGLFVGNDSGVSHLAAAAGGAVCALYGPTDPAVWAPVGARVRCVRAPNGSLAELAVETVRDFAAPLLRSSARGSPEA
jgi:heptosyltransferase-3